MYVSGDRGGVAGPEVDACQSCCLQPANVKTEERWVYVGDGLGNYSQMTQMEMVGHGRGEYEKEKVATVGAWRLRSCCLVLGCMFLVLGALLALAFLNNWWSFDAFDAPQPECLPAILARVDGESLLLRQRCCARGYTQFCAG